MGNSTEQLDLWGTPLPQAREGSPDSAEGVQDVETEIMRGGSSERNQDSRSGMASTVTEPLGDPNPAFLSRRVDARRGALERVKLKWSRFRLPRRSRAGVAGEAVDSRRSALACEGWGGRAPPAGRRTEKVRGGKRPLMSRSPESNQSARSARA